MQTYKLLEEDTVLLSQPLLIQHFGRAGAQFLSQLHYWLEHSGCGQQHQGQKWIYNTEKTWASQLKLSARQFRRYVSQLTSKGIIFVKKLNPHKSNRTNYFSINYTLLDELIKNNPGLFLDKPPESSCFIHEDIMSPPLGHSVPIYIETKTTNKDLNKSDGLSIKQAGQGGKPINQVNQVNQVKNNNFKKNEKIKEKHEEAASQALSSEKLRKIQSIGKITTTRDMLAIWNETLGEKAKVSMSKELAPLLVSAYSKKFEQDLGQWRRYCELIRSSSYLMGGEFVLSPFWALKFGVIDRMRAGEFGVKLRYFCGQGSNDHIIVDGIKIQQLIDELDESLEAKATRLRLAEAIGAAAYHSWFHQARFIRKDGEIQLVAPNSFVEQIWESQFPWVQHEKTA